MQLFATGILQHTPVNGAAFDLNLAKSLKASRAGGWKINSARGCFGEQRATIAVPVPALSQLPEGTVSGESFTMALVPQLLEQCLTPLAVSMIKAAFRLLHCAWAVIQVCGWAQPGRMEKEVCHIVPFHATSLVCLHLRVRAGCT